MIEISPVLIDPILSKMQRYFFYLYGKRNSIYFSGLSARINSLNIVIGDLQDVIRKKHSKKKIGMALARVIGRIFCIADNFTSLDLSKAMAIKYPVNRCIYCGEEPCICKEDRPEPKYLLDKINIDQWHIWTIGDWQEHLAGIYGAKNRKKGKEKILNRLTKEVSELLSLQARIPELKMSLDEIEMEFAYELADSLAWTIAVANFFRIDLQDEIYKRYKDGCWKCHDCPCECRGISFAPIDWDKIEVD